jgi:hypothetical protein
MTDPQGPEVVLPPPGQAGAPFALPPDMAPRPYAGPAELAAATLLSMAAGAEDQAAAPAPSADLAATLQREHLAADLAARDAAVEQAAAAAGWLTMYDRAKACGTPGQPAPPNTNAVLIYAGGLTPDPWTAADIAAQTARYRLPCWVARGAGTDAGASEAREFLNWLKEHRAPRRRLLVLDLETRNTGPDHDYELAFRRVIAGAGYWLALYGSTGNLFTYPAAGGGFFVADPPAAGQAAQPHMFDHPQVAITQWRFAIPGQDWDLSVMRAEVRALLWDTAWTTPALAQAHHLQAEADELVRLIEDYAGA